MIIIYNRLQLTELNEEDLPVIKNPLDKTRGNNICLLYTSDAADE